MHGLHIGNLKVQVSEDVTFETGVEDIAVRWYNDGATAYTTSTVISGQQQLTPEAGFRIARFGANEYGSQLNGYLGKRFYIRLLYTAGVSHLGDCAIDLFQISFATGTAKRNSFK